MSLKDDIYPLGAGRNPLPRPPHRQVIRLLNSQVPCRLPQEPPRLPVANVRLFSVRLQVVDAGVRFQPLPVNEKLPFLFFSTGSSICSCRSKNTSAPVQFLFPLLLSTRWVLPKLALLRFSWPLPADVPASNWLCKRNPFLLPRRPYCPCPPGSPFPSRFPRFLWSPERTSRRFIGDFPHYSFAGGVGCLTAQSSPSSSRALSYKVSADRVCFLSRNKIFSCQPRNSTPPRGSS